MVMFIVVPVMVLWAICFWIAYKRAYGRHVERLVSQRSKGIESQESTDTSPELDSVSPAIQNPQSRLVRGGDFDVNMRRVSLGPLGGGESKPETQGHTVHFYYDLQDLNLGKESNKLRALNLHISGLPVGSPILRGGGYFSPIGASSSVVRGVRKTKAADWFGAELSPDEDQWNSLEDTNDRVGETTH